MTQDKDIRNGVWVTPHSFFGPLHAEFNLEIDAAASADNAMLPRYWDERINVEIRFVKKRIKFSGTTGAGKFPSMVVIFR